MKTLLLWDIDCTLIDAGGAGERGLIRALKSEFGIEDTLRWLDFSGRTDYWIARTILEHHFRVTNDSAVRRFLDGYLAVLSDEMKNPRARVLPGIQEVVARAADSHQVAQGLLTGNLQSGARVKLSHFQLWSYFPFGAFADDAEDRNHLGPFALNRAALHHGNDFSRENVVVIGDTPHDIACGKAIGARTLAVATGRYSLEDLKSHRPTAAFADFSRPAELWAFLN